MMFYFVVFLIWYIQISSSVPQRFDDGCRRDLSRSVRKFIEKEIYSNIMNIKPNDLPQTCQFHPLNDIYYYQEKLKSELNYREYKCNSCNKIFRSEYYLDKHIHSKHPETLNVS